MIESRKSRLAGKNGKSSVILKKFAVSVVVKLRSSFILQMTAKPWGLVQRPTFFENVG